MRITVKRSPYCKKSWLVYADKKYKGTLTRTYDNQLMWTFSNGGNFADCACVYLPKVPDMQTFTTLLKVHF